MSDDEWVPKTKAEQRMLKRYRGWSKRKRREAALKKILDEGFTVTQAVRTRPAWVASWTL
ncbi:MAG: hypothetical protein AAFZ07_04705 [Actinomycetota bacterium]